MCEHRRRLYAEAVSDARRSPRVGCSSRAGSGTRGTRDTYGANGTLGTNSTCTEPRQRRRLCVIRHRVVLTRRPVPKRRRGSERFRLQRIRSLRLPAARRADAARGPRTVSRRQERRPRPAGARRPGVLQHRRPRRLACWHRDRRRSIHPRPQRARRRPRGESHLAVPGQPVTSAPNASTEALDWLTV